MAPDHQDVPEKTGYLVQVERQDQSVYLAVKANKGLLDQLDPWVYKVTLEQRALLDHKVIPDHREEMDCKVNLDLTEQLVYPENKGPLDFPESKAKGDHTVLKVQLAVEAFGESLALKVSLGYQEVPQARTDPLDQQVLLVQLARKVKQDHSENMELPAQREQLASLGPRAQPVRSVSA